MKNSLFFAIVSLLYLDVMAQTQTTSHIIKLPNTLFSNSNMPFLSHHDNGTFGKVLAMNINYEPVQKIRIAIEKSIGVNLKIFKGWNSEGEAHITTITPPEYTNVFSSFVSIQEIDDIAKNNDIQNSDLQIEGIGRGFARISGANEETYFLIVRSERLLKIRREIYKLFLNRGGNSKSWDPEHFFPHITIGFSLRDLHESDGVIKDKAHSLDDRFILDIEYK